MPVSISIFNSSWHIYELRVQPCKMFRRAIMTIKLKNLSVATFFTTLLGILMSSLDLRDLSVSSIFSANRDLMVFIFARLLPTPLKCTIGTNLDILLFLMLIVFMSYIESDAKLSYSFSNTSSKYSFNWVFSVYWSPVRSRHDCIQCMLDF